MSSPDDGVDPAALDVEFDITVVDREEGQRLAVPQAQAILDLLTWLHEHAIAEPDE